VESEKPGFLYIVAVNSSKDISMIYPVRGENNYVAGNKTVTALPKDDRYFQFSKKFPAGAVRLKVFLTGVPIHISGADDIKILNRQQLSDQSLKSEGIDTEDLFGVSIIDDSNSNEMVSMCWLTRRLRMARQQRRAVANSVEKFTETGEITPPQVDEEEVAISDTEMDAQEVEPEPKPVDADPDTVTGNNEPSVSPKKEPEPEPIDNDSSTVAKKDNQDKELSDSPKKEPEPKPVDNSHSTVTEVNEPPAPSTDKPEPKPAENVPSTVTGSNKQPDPSVAKPGSVLDDNPFIEMIGKKSNENKTLPDILGSQSNNTATNFLNVRLDGTLQPNRTLNNNYSETITRNARTLFKGFAQDEVLIIFSDKSDRPIQ
jgi:hypothetical protein